MQFSAFGALTAPPIDLSSRQSHTQIAEVQGNTCDDLMPGQGASLGRTAYLCFRGTKDMFMNELTFAVSMMEKMGKVILGLRNCICEDRNVKQHGVFKNLQEIIWLNLSGDFARKGS